MSKAGDDLAARPSVALRSVAEMYSDLTSGIAKIRASMFAAAEKRTTILIVKDISIASVFEHHRARSSGVPHRVLPNTAAWWASKLRGSPNFARRLRSGTPYDQIANTL